VPEATIAAESHPEAGWLNWAGVNRLELRLVVLKSARVSPALTAAGL
jgi:hypothetical protein